MPALTPVTQRDVAAACGLHPSTVCLALKNAPSIPEETRRRIRGLAEEMGYRPNAAARNLALLRTERKTGEGLPLAWINQEQRRDHWRADPDARVCFEGARRRAGELGYRLEEVWAGEAGMSPARLQQIVRARGIEGVLFPVDRTFDFDLPEPGWRDFALAGLNDHRLGAWIDVVCPDHYRNMALAWQALRAEGFGRIGLVLSPQFDAASNGLARSCYLRHQADLGGYDRLPVCFASHDAGFGSVAGWFREHRPEAVLTDDQGTIRQARQTGLEASWVRLQGGGAECGGGIDGAAAEVAAAAVDLVVEKMRRFEKGTRASTRVQLVPGVWREGGGARRQVPALGAA